MLCTICGRFPVASEDDDSDFCMLCGTQGKQFERWLSGEERSFLLTEIRELPGVRAAELSGSSNGNFRLMVGFTEREEILEVIAGRKDDEGEVWLQGLIPPADHPWGIGIIDGASDWHDFSQMRFSVVQDVFDDEEVVQAVAVLAEGGSLESKEVTVKNNGEDGPRMALGFMVPEQMLEVLNEDSGYEEMVIGSTDDPGVTAQADQYLAQALDAVRDSAKGQRRWVVMCETDDGLIALTGQGPETQVGDGEFAMACSLTLIKSLRRVNESREEDDEQQE